MVAECIDKLLSIEEYSFSLDELMEQTTKSKNAIWQELAHLIEKNKVLNLRKGFYLILTPRYSSFGKLPIDLYIEKLFEYLGRNYYLGFYSAAKVYGASHQQIQRDYVMTSTPKLLDIKKSAIDIRFLTTSAWPEKNILPKKSDAGTYHISSPALTLADLIHYQNKLGGLNRMLSTIEELLEEVTQKDLEDLLSWYGNKATLQRLGFLLDQIDQENRFSNLIFQHLEKQKIHPVLLKPTIQQRPGSVDNKWKVDVNLRLETDL
ncbi:type IV toxin-antitoxin system AbiEi family antitoxin [Leeuwenhoekiella polynyae]|jgi:predicted transcriptional regulator of viral defense system|uniref:Type IV toxin-antitoxin system AbiEi family antitoxin n=2 Tax=Flavobacteriaceae TaxID=49546 RepID=A0ABS7EUH5_9FLAO|nr:MULTISPECIES: type IV toxin-antitoxin system AbiEi family antitoxin [Flavobacteriaceae]MBW8201233.1 type IV toxin-antitoxin system AbiEi family antitoxin [Allomuricauda abyssi]RXG14840.1 putative transcriptional regulator of viral defense system [Leeuwenhoekiella polynyae]|tara:strand:+ start:3250 stop:4038 length:789 start_codon:yes stop_codon:yes gene_type:complete